MRVQDYRPESYNFPGYQVFAGKDGLSRYLNNVVVSHWHDDLEFTVVISGHMQYNVNGNVIKLREGSGIFVNSRQLHSVYSEDKSECLYICVLINPSILRSLQYIDLEFVRPIISSDSFMYCNLNKSIGWQSKILKAIINIYESSKEKMGILKIQSLIFEIWEEVYKNINTVSRVLDSRYDKLPTLKSMIEFIQKKYRDKITLTDIAAAGNVCKSNCCSIFKKYLNQTAITYLNNYRLCKSIDLLLNSDNRTIAEICYEVGFSGASYYSESFRKHFGCSPGEYAKNFKTGDKN